MKQLRMGGTPLNGKTIRERTTVEKGAGILNRDRPYMFDSFKLS